MTTAGAISLALVVFGAPLAVGSVHRPAMLVVTLLAGVSAAVTVVGQAARGRGLRLTPSVLLPLLLLAIPLIQSIPLPAKAVARIDPAGAALLAESSLAHAALRPLSLDPPETRAVVARAAAVLAVFLSALHLASGRSYRQLLMRVIAASTVAAVVIGLGHRLLGEDQIYGHFWGSRGLFNGPFINSNHLAEFMELGAFVCVACALAGASALNRVGWLTAALMAGVGALGSLSRGAVVGLAAGTIAFVALRRSATAGSEDTDEPTRRAPRTMLWVVVMLILLGAAAVILGAEQIATRVATTNLSEEARWRVWRESLNVLFAHPFGIGRGAFERVFPVYRSVEGAISVRFSFVENEPLQYLVEMGWLGFAAVATAGTLLAVEWFRARRSDAVEAALVAGLVAVAVHNLFDFGLETLGIALPFAAILGTLLGRSRDVGGREVSRPRSWLVLATGAVGIVVGTASLTHASARDFDAQLQKAVLSQSARRELALQAQAAHPTDYFYVLVQAMTEPATPDSAGRSPRLHALNHCLLLCPRCPEVHSAVAATLWALGRRRQALDEWRVAAETLPVLYSSIVEKVWSAGARPEEIALLAGGNPDKLIWSVSFLMSKNQVPAAKQLLPMAAQAGASQEEVLLIDADLDIRAGAIDDALKDLSRARGLAPQDPRIFQLMGEANVRAGKIDDALLVLEQGIGMTPHDLPMLRRRLEIIMNHQKWHLAQAALASLEAGLAEAQQPTAEIHLASARYHASLRDYPKASAEYSLYLTQVPGDARAWLELGSMWEGTGRIAQALDTFHQASTMAPGNPAIIAAVQRLEGRVQSIRSGLTVTP